MKRNFPRLALLGLLAIAAPACRKAIPDIDRSRIQSGNGWFCHKHPRGDDSVCWRNEASCDKLLATFRGNDPKGYAGESCKPQPSAWCFVRPADEPISWSCKVNL